MFKLGKTLIYATNATFWLQAAKLPGNSGSIANAELILNALKLVQRVSNNRQNADSAGGFGLQLAGTLADLQAEVRFLAAGINVHLDVSSLRNDVMIG